MSRTLDEYLQKPSDDDSIPFYQVRDNDLDFKILPLLILNSYLKGEKEFSIKFNKVPTISQFEKLSSIISQLPGLEITYITVKEIFIKYIASYEELDLSKVDESWIKLLLETSEYILKNNGIKPLNKAESKYLQYRKRAEKLFLKRNLTGHSKFFVKLILENILNIIADVWNSFQDVKSTKS